MPWGMPPFGPPDLLLVVLMAIASYTDVRTMKIKNWLTFPMMVAGMLLSVVYLPHPWEGVAGVVVAFVVCLPLYLVGPVLSAGDVKMLMAAGALMGPEAAIRATLFSVALILPVAIGLLAAKKRFGNVTKVLKGEAPPTMLFHAPVISLAIVITRVQPLPDIFSFL